MPWITRDNDGGKSPYRIFGERPVRAYFVSYDGDVQETFTWTLATPTYVSGTKSDYLYDTIDDFTYKPLSNTENTAIAEVDSPIYLEPGEGPIEVHLSLVKPIPERSFSGEGI